MKRDYYIMPFIFATASVMAAVFLAISGTLQISHGGHHEGFSIMTSIFPAYGVTMVAFVAWFICSLILSIRSRRGELIFGAVLGDVMGIVMSLVFVFVLMTIGMLPMRLLRAFGLAENMVMPIGSVIGSILGVFIAAKFISYIHRLSGRLRFKTKSMFTQLFDLQKDFFAKNNIGIDELKVLTKEETKALRQKWADTYIKNAKEDPDILLHRCQFCIPDKNSDHGYNWHIFSYEEVASKQVEIDFFKEHKVAEDKVIFLWEECNYLAVELASRHLISMDFSVECCDIYVFPKDLSWTFVSTHENGWIGPFYSDKSIVGNKILGARIMVGQLIKEYVAGYISLGEATRRMPDLTIIRDESIDSVDHLLNHIILENRKDKIDLKYIENLTNQLSQMSVFLLDGKEIDNSMKFKPFYGSDGTQAK